MDYTEGQLNSKNKGQVVNIALEAMERLNAISAQALTASGLEREMLLLAKQEASVKDNAIKREQEYDIAMAKIEADNVKDLAELRLKHGTTSGIEAEALKDLYAELEGKAEKAKSDLTFGLKEFENEMTEKKEKIALEVLKIETEYSEELDAIKLEVEIAGEKAFINIANINKKNERDLEDIKYKHSIALRDQNLGAASDIAKEIGCLVIEENKYIALKTYQKISEDDLAVMITDAEKASASKTHAENGAKHGKLMSDANLKISLLENDKKHLITTNASLEHRIQVLQDQVKEFPVQMKDAVEAAKTTITNTIEQAKK